MNAKLRNVRQEPMHVAAARIVLGATFASAALSYFWQQALGWPLLPMRITDRGMQFAVGIIRVGYLWPLMKAINLLAGVLLIANRAPAFALALLTPVTVVIIWFQVFLNPLPIPLITVAVVVLSEAMLYCAYGSCYAGMFRNDRWELRRFRKRGAEERST
jgi:putative oxidoreductase